MDSKIGISITARAHHGRWRLEAPRHRWMLDSNHKSSILPCSPNEAIFSAYPPRQTITRHAAG